MEGFIIKTYPIKTVDAFTTVPFGGNPAGVVIDAVGLTEREMQKIANEMNLVETTFIFPPTNSDADYLIRYFTPQSEVAVAGHPTIATIHALIEEGKILINKLPQQIKVETGAGILLVEITLGEEDNYLINLTLATPQFHTASLTHAQMAELLGTDNSNLDMCPIQKIYTGLYWYVVRLKTLDAIQNLRPNFGEIAELSRREKVTGIQVFTTETVDPQCNIHVRTFLPNEGINEDPVCGTGNGCIGSYIVENGIVDTNGKIQFTSEQGLELGRPGRVYVEVEGKSQGLTKVTVSGTAITVMNGELKF